MPRSFPAFRQCGRDRLIQVATERGELHRVFIRRKRKAEILEALGHATAAWQEAHTATTVGREDPDFTALISMGLDLESDLAVESGEIRRAGELLDEARHILAAKRLPAPSRPD